MVSRLNCSRSTTHGFCVLGFLSFAPSSLLSLSLDFAASTSSGVGSRKTSTNRLPSGAQSKSCTSCAVLVSFCASPPCRFRTHTCVLPLLRADKNARNLPFGLQRGCDD